MNNKKIKGLFSAFIAIALIIMNIIPAFATENTLIDTTHKISFTLNCDKPGYIFRIYKVASLDSTSTSPYSTDYNSLVPPLSSEEVSKAINDGDTSGLLKALDDIETLPETVKKVGSFGRTSATVTSKTFTDLAQGIYYVRAEDFPAGVQSVTNSVFALPYYPDNETGWTYELDDIELAAKVVDKDITTKKTITNSTKDNENYTDVSLGDTVNFRILSTVTGSTSMKLNSYLVTDDMSKGLTINKDSFKFALLKEDESKITDLDSSEYDITYDTGFDGTDINKNTKFTVSLTKDYLQQDEFYDKEVYYTSITYSAILNKNAVIGTAGNPNTEGKIEYSNKNGVTVTHEGNTVYVYTYAIATNKADTAGTALEGAEFKIFKTKENANAQKDEIATGTSDGDGKVLYYNSNGEEMKFQSGTYYIVETKAPKGYNLYGKVIEITINAEYGDTLVNGTYVTNCPADGYAVVDVKDSKVVVPQTGGFGTGFFYVIGAVLFIGGIAVFSRRKKLSKAISE